MDTMLKPKSKLKEKNNHKIFHQEQTHSFLQREHQKYWNNAFKKVFPALKLLSTYNNLPFLERQIPLQKPNFRINGYQTRTIS